MPLPSEPTPIRVATLDDVYVAFNEIGGRNPNYEQGEHSSFVGMEYSAMRLAVYAYFNPGAPIIEPDPPPTVTPKPKETTPVVVGGDIESQILQKALDALKAIQIIKSEMEGQVKKKVEEAFPGLQTALEAIRRQLNTSMTTIIPNTISLVGAALGGVETLLATFLSNAADIGDIGDVISDTVTEKSAGIAGWFMDLAVGPDFNLAGEIGAKIMGAFQPDVSAVDEAISTIAAITPIPTPVEF